MNNVLSFPAHSAPSMVDPPPVDPSSADLPRGCSNFCGYTIGLEHEVADLEHVVATQERRLAKKRAAIRRSRIRCARRMGIALLVGIATGWFTAPSVPTPAQASNFANELFGNPDTPIRI